VLQTMIMTITILVLVALSASTSLEQRDTAPTCEWDPQRLRTLLHVPSSSSVVTVPANNSRANAPNELQKLKTTINLCRKKLKPANIITLMNSMHDVCNNGITGAKQTINTCRDAHVQGGPKKVSHHQFFKRSH